MANEAVLNDRTHEPINFTVADGAAIEKGAVLKMTDNRVAIINSGVNDILAGINAREKILSDGRTSTPVFRRGVFTLTASGSITTGDAVAVAAEVNHVWSALATTKSGSILGHALMDATDNQTLQIDVDVGSGTNAVS